MSDIPTHEEKRLAKEEADAAHAPERRKAELEIFSKTSRQIGGVAVNFTFGRIRKNGDRGSAA